MTGDTLFDVREPAVDGEATLGYLDSRAVYRYQLVRKWEPGDATAVNWVMLNPSMADANRDDATIRRVIRYTRDWGYGAAIVTNLYAWRATDPAELWRVERGLRVGGLNGHFLETSARKAALVVCAWGTHGGRDGRAAEVLELLTTLEVVPHALSCCAGGEPGHPLYLPLTLTPRPLAELKR